MIVNAANKQFGDNKGPYYRQVEAERVRRAAAGLNDNDYNILTADGQIIRLPKPKPDVVKKTKPGRRRAAVADGTPGDPTVAVATPPKRKRSKPGPPPENNC